MPDPLEHLRTVIDTLGVPLTQCNRNFIFEWVSGAYAEWFGVPAEDIMGRPLAEVFGSEAFAGIRPHIERVLNGERVEYEAEFTVPIRGRRAVHAVYMPTFNGLSRPSGWFAVIRDVTTEREAERALRNVAIDRQLLSAIVQSADDAIISKDLNSVITSWNLSAERIFGYSAAEAIGHSVALIIPDDRRAEEDDILARVREGERLEHFQTIRKRKDGRLIPVSLTISPIRLASGEIVGASKVARDVSAQKQSSERATFLTQVAAVLSGTLDYESMLTTIANLAVPFVADWCAVDVVRDGTIARLGVAHVDPDKIALAQTIRERYEDPRSPYSVPFVLAHATAAWIPTISDEMIVAAARGDEERIRLVRSLGITSYMCVPLIAHGRTLGALTFATGESGRTYTDDDLQFAKDIAHRAALALDNAQAYDEAQRANRVKDEFLATLSHELRTPLNAILGYARILRSGLLAPDRHPKAIDTIERNASALTQIVDDVLDVSRIISGKVRLDVQPVDLPQVVEHAVETIMPAANAKSIRVRTTLDPHAAPIAGDPGRLLQIVWNVLSNAVKFTSRGGQVQVRLERVNSHLEIVVSDTGVGIPPEFLPHLFERFRQADASTTRERGGLGLGLAIARHLVEMHGGTIHASSHGLGTGATFTVRLPVMIVHPTSVSDRRVHPRGQATDAMPAFPDLAGVHVLAVDDDRDALDMVREILELTGAKVTAVDSGAEALGILMAIRPDVVIADLGMPQMDGFEFIARVRQLPSPQLQQVPVAALTAYARSEDRTKSLRSGFQMHLAKPIDPAELVAAIAALSKRPS